MVSSWTRAVWTRSVAISRLHNASHRCATLALVDKLSRPRTSLPPATTSIIRITHKYASSGRLYAVIITTANSDHSRPNSFRDSWCLQATPVNDVRKTLSLSLLISVHSTRYIITSITDSPESSAFTVKHWQEKKKKKGLWVWRSSYVRRHIQNSQV